MIKTQDVKPEFIMLIGLPGSGKSTYANSTYGKDIQSGSYVHLSSDLIRKELYGDECIQGNPQEVFALMQKRCLDYLNKGINVVYDATNIVRKFRKTILSMLPQNVVKKAIITWAPVDMCIERQLNRDRLVNKSVIYRMLCTFQAPFYDEGFNSIDVIYPENFDFIKYRLEQINNMNISQDNSHHTLDVNKHCELCSQLVQEETPNESIINAARIHDIGKPFTKKFANSKGEPTEEAHYYNHQNVGSYISYGVFDDIFISWLICYHMEPFFNSKYYKQLSENLKNAIDIIHAADMEAK